MRCAAIAGVLVAAAALAWSCAPRPDPGLVPELRLPSEEQFIDGGVSAFMGRRCGSLDCHGDVARPLRLYDEHGLRRVVLEGGVRDPGPTTPAEHHANYDSVIGLEPEELGAAASTGADVPDIMLVKKPLGVEGGGVRHKGGPVLLRSNADPGWVCLTSWLEERVDPASCRQATF